MKIFHFFAYTSRHDERIVGLETVEKGSKELDRTVKNLPALTAELERSQSLRFQKVKRPILCPFVNRLTIEKLTSKLSKG